MTTNVLAPARPDAPTRPDYLTDDQICVLACDPRESADQATVRCLCDAWSHRRPEIGDLRWRAARGAATEIWTRYVQRVSPRVAHDRLAGVVVDRLTREVLAWCAHGSRRSPEDRAPLSVLIALDPGCGVYRVARSGRALAEGEIAYGVTLHGTTPVADLRARIVDFVVQTFPLTPGHTDRVRLATTGVS